MKQENFQKVSHWTQIYHKVCHPVKSINFQEGKNCKMPLKKKIRMFLSQRSHILTDLSSERHFEQKVHGALHRKYLFVVMIQFQNSF